MYLRLLTSVVEEHPNYYRLSGEGEMVEMFETLAFCRRVCFVSRLCLANGSRPLLLSATGEAHSYDDSI